MIRSVIAAAMVLAFAAFSPANAEGACTSSPRIVRDLLYKAQDLKAQDLAEMSDRDLALYVAGFTNGLIGFTVANSTKECIEQVDQCVAKRNNMQLAAILKKYLSDHPE